MLKLKGQNINQLLLYVDFFIFYALTWPNFLTTAKGTFKKENMKDEHFDWLGQESGQNVARTRK